MRKLKVFDHVGNETSSFVYEELSYYLKRLLGVSISKTDRYSQADIHLELMPNTGNCVESKKINDEDRIYAELHRGIAKLRGSNNISLLIAVYRLLSQLGVGFFRPGRDNEFIPFLEMEKWEKTEIRIEETAAYRHRGVCIEGADSLENILEFIDFLPKIQMNSFFIQFENPYPFLKRWYEHENNPYMEKERFDASIADEMSRKIDAQIKKRGLKHHRVGHGWISEALGFSSKYGWQEEKRLNEDKINYLAAINGKKELYRNSPILTSLCFSNEMARKEMISRIVEYASARQDVDYLHVWLSDAPNNICECERCRKTTPSDQYIELLNELDRELTKRKLDTKICFLLYHELLFPPVKSRIKNPGRYIMMFAPISRTFERSYGDVNLEMDIPCIPSYVRNKMALPTTLEENISYLLSWQETFHGDAFVYDYPLGRAHYGDMGYMKISEIIYRDILSLERLKLNGYISCQELRAGFPHNFPSYVMGHTLWNKEISYEALKERYFTGLYGKYARQTVEYLEEISALCSPDYFNAKGSRINKQISEGYEQLEQIVGEFGLMLNKMKEDEEGNKREVETLLYHRDYVLGMSGALRLLSSGEWDEAQKRFADIMDRVRKKERHYQKLLDVYRLVEVSTNYTGFKAHLCQQ